ncbi:hypothetical protein CsSME_00039767 [Camellia sinensis var. sinensis]
MMWLRNNGREPCLRTSEPSFVPCLGIFYTLHVISLFWIPFLHALADHYSVLGDSDTGIIINTPQALWTRGRRLNRSEDLIDGQPVFHSLPPVIRRRQGKHSVSEQRSPEQWLPSLVDSRIEIPIVATELNLPVVQIDQNSMAAPTGVEEMMRQMQETMRAMQQDAVRRDELAKQQTEIMTQQAELITRL